VADYNTNELLISSGVITRELAQRASQLSGTTASSRVGRLVAAGANQKQVLDTLGRLTGIPVATDEMLAWASPVPMLPQAARQLRDILACPIKRDHNGILHVAIADPETVNAVDMLLINFKVYLAPEANVRALLQNLYSVGSGGQAEPIDAVDIDLEASRKNVRGEVLGDAIDIDLEASMKNLRAVPSDPLAARSSGSFNRPRADEETMRVQRSPKPPGGAQSAQGPTVNVVVPPPSDALLKAAYKRGLINGVLLGFTVAALLAAVLALVAR
jgi:hypothetical protein